MDDNNISRMNIELTQAEQKAFADLIAAGYPFPAKTKIGVIRKMLRDVWPIVFDDKEFPKDG